MIIAIDGPCAAGKSTTSDEVAKKLNFSHLDTGAMFRAVAYAAARDDIDFLDEDKLEKIAREEKIVFENEDGSPAYKKIFIGGEDVTNKIRTEEVNKAVTPVCKHAKVREALLEQQREIGETGNYVVDGRDIGSVVFPNAELKVFMTASDEERAQRRVLQNEITGVGSTDFDEVLADIQRRDYEDINRDVAPLIAADDAIVINTTAMDQDEVIDKIIDLAKERM